MRLFYILFILLSLGAYTQDNPLSVFEPLVDHTWEAEGNWGNGTKFKQLKSFKYDLNKTLVISESRGYTNQEQTEFGPRNHGIYQFDKKENLIRFWEFDVFGGLTEGTLTVDGKSFYYQYAYGGSFITDYWEYIDDSTYRFTVGTYKDGQWEQVYIKTEFKLLEP